MTRERLEIIISNLLQELYDKSFDCNQEQFIYYLHNEIGMSYEEMANLVLFDNFPDGAKKIILDRVSEKLEK